MMKLCRLSLPLLAALFFTGCSSIHNTIAPDKKQSELRAAVEEPVEVTLLSQFCMQPLPEPITPAVAPAPYNAKLYFLLDKTVLTDESQRRAAKIYQEVLKRDSSEVTVVGHTDTSASNSYNDALSNRRAEKVKQDLIEVGVPEEVISISSHGEYILEVDTPDGTVEVKNRRVEIHAR